MSGHGHDLPRRRCVVCRAPSTALLCTAETIGRDLGRARRGLDGFVHDHARAVYRCASCGSAFRDPLARRGDDVARYARCRYRRDTLDELCRKGRAELDRRAPSIRARGVVAGARLLEIGSYSGAFLEFAADAGCRVTGIDINADVVAHCEARGLEIHCEAFDPERFEVGEFDGVWILNCFEQLSDHTRVLAGAARVLRPNGTLVIRTPNADFVRLLYAPRGGAILRSVGRANALLGVPFAKCFSAGALTERSKSTAWPSNRWRARSSRRLRPASGAVVGSGSRSPGRRVPRRLLGGAPSPVSVAGADRQAHGAIAHLAGGRPVEPGSRCTQGPLSASSSRMD